jgi:hypothetical protein
MLAAPDVVDFLVDEFARGGLGRVAFLQLGPRLVSDLLLRPASDSFVAALVAPSHCPLRSLRGQARACPSAALNSLRNALLELDQPADGLHIPANVLDDVVQADDPAQPSTAIDDGEPTDSLLAHEFDRLVETLVFSDRDWLSRHEVADLPGPDVLAVIDPAFQEGEHEIAVRHDSHGSLLMDDDDRAHVVVIHETCHILDKVVSAGRDDLPTGVVEDHLSLSLTGYGLSRVRAGRLLAGSATRLGFAYGPISTSPWRSYLPDPLRLEKVMAGGSSEVRVMTAPGNPARVSLS